MNYPVYEEDGMNIKKCLLTGLWCLVLWLSAGTAWAGENKGVDKEVGRTDVIVGVSVEYMLKLRFEVYRQETNNPIEGASVELYIPSLDRYVLFGLTDADGVYELDIVYTVDTSTDFGAQFETVDGMLTFQGTKLYVSNNEIQYQVYKSGLIPYPYQGTKILTGNEIPAVVVVYLYREKIYGSNSDSDDSSSSSSNLAFDDSVTPTDETELLPDQNEGEKTGGIPKTGVEGAVPYWIAGAVFFSLAGAIFCYLWKKEKEKGKEMWG